jgi:hypothetical protein
MAARRQTWQRAFKEWVEEMGLDPIELDKSSVSRGAFEAGWRKRRRP